jgi:flagellar hook-associated protein FlgK
MSLFSSIETLGSSMRAFQYGIDVTQNNLANAATPGYSREVLNLEPSATMTLGSLQLGTGVQATNVQRIHDSFLDSQIQYEQSQLGYATATQAAVNQLAAIFPEVASPSATTGLTAAINNVVSAWSALAAAPNSTAAKTTVVGTLTTVASMLQTDAQQVYNLQVNLDQQVQSTVTQINSLSDQIANLNQQIKLATAQGQGNAPGALLDMREQAAEKLANLINANFTIVADGSMVVTFSGGVLADGNQAKHLALIPSNTQLGATDIGYYQTAKGLPTDVTAQISSGVLGGLLQARDGSVQTARLQLDQIAHGIITRSNEINDSYVAGDGTTSHDLLSGNSAADITINPIVAADPDYVGGTRDALAPGDLAKIQGQLENFIQFSSMRTATGSSLGGGGNVDPTLPIGSQVFAAAPSVTATPATPGQMVIATTGNAVTITWDNTQSINQIIRNINAAGAGAFYATFDNATQKFILVGDTPMNVYDVTGNLADVLMISSSVISSAPINQYPVPGPVANEADAVGPLNDAQNMLNLFTKTSTTGGSIQVDGNTINWTPADQIQISLALAIQGATPAPAQVGLTWDANTQTVTLEKSGDPFSANAGSHDFTGLGNTMSAIQVEDISGNLAQALNLDTDTNSSKILGQLVSSLSTQSEAASVAVQQAQAMVNQTQQLQNNVSQVDPAQETAQAMLYQRSFEASVRLQAIIDDMLNVLINQMGSPDSSSVSTG